MTKKRLIILILVVIAVWYFWGRSQKANGPAQPAPISAEQEIPAGDEGEEAAREAEGELAEPVNAGKARVHYFTAAALGACSRETTAAEQNIDAQYGHSAAGALVAQTLPMPGDAPEGLASALALGTRLLSMQISKEAVATANYNDKLNEELNDCNGPQRRAQIENTLREFAEIKEVVITVNGQVWE